MFAYARALPRQTPLTPYMLKSHKIQDLCFVWCVYLILVKAFDKKHVCDDDNNTCVRMILKAWGHAYLLCDNFVFFFQTSSVQLYVY